MTIKNKIGEISRLQKFIEESGLQLIEIAEKAEVSERSIQNTIWEDNPIGGKLLRNLHLNLGVSMDWLLTGSGHMMANQTLVSEEAEEYNTAQNPRTARICQFVTDWMSYASEDEQAWLETELKFNITQFRQYLNDKNND